MWITISSGVLGFSFIFGNTLSNQLQTILLIFVVHPFDVGDALLLNGAFHTVEQTSLNKARCGTGRGVSYRLTYCPAAELVPRLHPCSRLTQPRPGAYLSGTPYLSTAHDRRPTIHRQCHVHASSEVVSYRDRHLTYFPEKAWAGGATIESLDVSQIIVRRWDGARIWYPTQLLVSAPIFNVTRVDSRCQAIQARALAAQASSTVMRHAPCKRICRFSGWLECLRTQPTHQLPKRFALAAHAHRSALLGLGC